MSTPEPAFTHEATIADPPQRVWDALTSGTLTRAYCFDRRVEFRWVVGAPVRFYDGDSDSDTVTDSGEVLECDPPRRLVYSFAPVGYPASRVAFELEPQSEGTRLRLVHHRLADPGDVEGWRAGWTPILTNLQAMLEGRPVETAAWPERPS